MSVQQACHQCAQRYKHAKGPGLNVLQGQVLQVLVLLPQLAAPFDGGLPSLGAGKHRSQLGLNKPGLKPQGLALAAMIANTE